MTSIFRKGSDSVSTYISFSDKFAKKREWFSDLVKKCSDIAKKQGVIFPQKQGNNFPVFLKTGNDFMLYHSPIVDLGSGISLMAILLVSVPLQCGNDYCVLKKCLTAI